MGQFGLLAIPVLLVTIFREAPHPWKGMPVWLQYLMETISPTPHLVAFAQGVRYRGADFSIVWPEILAMASIGAVYLAFAPCTGSAASSLAAECRDSGAE